MGAGIRSDTMQALQQRMDALGIRDADLDEQFVRGSGSGGQKRNKTSSCVVLTHRPTGVEVRCDRERSQSLNRLYARRELCDRIEALRTGKVQAAAAERAKVRRQKARRARKTKLKLLEHKAHRKEKKAARGRPREEY